MNLFQIKGDNGFLKIEIIKFFGFPDRTSHYGGYECRAKIELEIPNYQVKGDFYTSTGEIFQFYEQLNFCHVKIAGIAEYYSSESNFELRVKYNDMGQTEITGKFQQYMGKLNCLEFELNSDQSYIKYTLDELQTIVNKYGNMTGIREH